MLDKNDWRLRGQEDYLHGFHFHWKQFSAVEARTDHEHCEFCWEKFMEKPEGIKYCTNAGYCSDNGKHWVCEACFADFCDEFAWKVD